MEVLKRKENETRNHFIWRVYKHRDETNELSKDEAGQICKEQLQETNDESAYRKKYQYFIDMWKDVKNEYVNEENLIAQLDELDIKKDELYKQKVKTRDKLREYRKCLRDEARIENLKEVAIECANIISKQNPIKLYKKMYINNNDKVAIIQLSDWHYANVIKNYWNDYDISIFHKRLSQLTTQVIEYCKLHNIKNLKVLNQGDLINGLIHVSARVINEEDIISQTQHVGEALANVLFEWAKYFNTVDYYSVLDNHSRVMPDKSQHIEKENFSKFIDWYLKARLQNVLNLKIHDNQIDDNIGVVDIFHEKAFFVHGHLDRPNNVVQNLTLMTRIFPIAVFLGHMHHNLEDEIHSIDLIMSPSMCGTDDYAVSVRSTGLARQKLTIYQNDNNKVKRLCTYFIEF